MFSCRFPSENEIEGYVTSLRIDSDHQEELNGIGNEAPGKISPRAVEGAFFFDRKTDICGPFPGRPVVPGSVISGFMWRRKA